MIWAVVPVKDFTTAKQRLSDFLSPAERSELAAAMLDDVIRALERAPGLDRLVVVTKEPRAIAYGRREGVHIIDEPVNEGESAAVRRAIDHALHHQASALVVIPGDVPLVSPEDVAAILEAGAHHQVVLVPSRDERGSNGVWLRPPDALPLRFGSDSFRPHRERARALNLTVTVVRRPNLALDIDTADDLCQLALRYGSAPELAARSTTAAFLQRIRWHERLRSSASTEYPT